MDTLDTRVLFDMENPEFKRATWEWKGGVAKDGKLPKLLFREGQKDTLYANIMQSVSCHDFRMLTFVAQTVPRASLNTI